MEDESWRRSLISRAGSFPKALFAFSRCSIPKARGSGDLLFHSPVHADARNGEDYSSGAAARRGKILTQIRLILVKADRLSVIRLENRLDFPYLINLLAKQLKIKLQTKVVPPQSEESDFDGPFTRMSRARAHQPQPCLCPSLTPTRLASTYGAFFSLPHT